MSSAFEGRPRAARLLLANCALYHTAALASAAGAASATHNEIGAPPPTRRPPITLTSIPGSESTVPISFPLSWHTC